MIGPDDAMSIDDFLRIGRDGDAEGITIEVAAWLSKKLREERERAAAKMRAPSDLLDTAKRFG